MGLTSSNGNDMYTTSYSHCPKCGQQLINGQFFCGHFPTGAIAKAPEPTEDDLMPCPDGSRVLCYGYEEPKASDPTEYKLEEVEVTKGTGYEFTRPKAPTGDDTLKNAAKDRVTKVWPHTLASQSFLGWWKLVDGPDTNGTEWRTEEEAWEDGLHRIPSAKCDGDHALIIPCADPQCWHKAPEDIEVDLPPLVTQGALIPKDLAKDYLGAPDGSLTLELIERIARREAQLKAEIAAKNELQRLLNLTDKGVQEFVTMRAQRDKAEKERDAAVEDYRELKHGYDLRVEDIDQLQRDLDAMTKDRDLWQDEHQDECLYFMELANVRRELEEAKGLLKRYQSEFTEAARN